MRMRLAWLPLLALGLAVLAGEDTAGPNFTLTVRPLKTQDDRVRKKETTASVKKTDALNPNVTWYSRPVDMTFVYERQALQVTIRNLGATQGAADVECLFFQKNVDDGRVQLAHREKARLELGPAAGSTRTYTSPTLRSSADRIEIDGKSQRIGAELAGYIVVLRDAQGKILKTASSKEYAKLVRDRAWLEQVLRTGSLAAAP